MRFALVLLVACHHGPTPPASPACTEVADHVYGMLPQDDHGKSVRDAFAARCAKDAWAPDARTCILVLNTVHDGHHCKDRLTPPQRSALDAELEAIEKRRAAELPPDCERYRLVMQKVGTCDKIPQASRDALQQSFEMTSRAWKNLAAQTPDARKAANDGCKQAFEAIQQFGKTMCAW